MLCDFFHKTGQIPLAMRICDLAATGRAICPDYIPLRNNAGQMVEGTARISSIRAAPETICADNGLEFISKAFDRWAYEKGVALDFSRSGDSTDNPVLDSSRASLRRLGRARI